MIRIAFLIRSLDRGGAERQLVNLVGRLDRKRFEPTVITLYSGGYFLDELNDAGVPVISLQKKRRWQIFGFMRRLLKELQRLQPDILHSYLVEPNLIATASKLFLRTKVVWGILEAKRDERAHDWFTRTNFRLQGPCSRYADLIIANSEAGRSYHLSHGFSAKRFIVIHAGVDLERFRPDREAGKKVRAEWDVPDGAILIGLVGRLDPIKDHHTFLRAAKILSQEQADSRFVCVGGGYDEYAAELRQLAGQIGIADRVIWAGPRDDMNAVYNALDILCSSSAGEGFPNVLCEAMACDVPCVVTNVGASALLVGDTGVVVQPNDPQVLAHGLSDLVRTRTERSSPRSRIEAQFGINQFVSRTEEALRGLVG